jgi:CubicO group peptidase (beta-lactamase class C family)
MKFSPLLRCASILLLSASAWTGANTFAQDAPATKLAPVLQPFVDSHILAGAVVLVADPDKVLDVEAVGWADIAAKKPMRPDSVFWIASQSKPIAATALMILVDEGKVNVDDPVEKYLPEFKGQQVNLSADPAHPQLQAPRHPILVREILSHTSGLPFKSAIEEPTLDVLPLAARVQSYAKEPLLFEPGTKSKYANAGLNTAGRIVEVVSGLSFEQFLDQRIFKPLGMTDTTFYPSKSQIERLAKSYKPNATKDGLEETTIGQLKYPLDDPERRPMPAGGLFSTAHDLSIFYRMMANNGVFHGTRILSEKSVKTMTSDQSGEANSHYGFGFGTDGKSFTHGGAYGTNSRFDIERKIITVFLVQHAGWSGNGKDMLHQFQKAALETYGAKVAATAHADAPHLVVGISGAPDAPAAPAKTIASVLQSFVDKHIAPGVVALVANKEGVLALEKAGYASLADKTPIRDDAVFWIASMSKSLTATALMMLVDEGKVSLDDPVEKYLPEFKGQMVAGLDGQDAPHPPNHPITVREIMDHTSGLVLASEKNLKRYQVLKDDVVEYAAHPLRQEPGTKYEYNNCGINTGGRIIEVVSGLSYADFMQKRLFDPLGMKDTTCWPNEEQVSRLAHTARFTEDKTDLVEVKVDANVPASAIEKLSQGVPVPAAITGDMGFGIAGDYGKHYAMPAGGYFSTAHDLSLLCRMLLRGGELAGKRYLSEKAVRTMSAVQTGDVKVNPQEAYGVGLSVKLNDKEGPAAGSFGHRGARRTAMWIDPKNGLAMIILVERFDMSGDQQTVMYGDFMKTAVAKFGAPAASQ